MIQVTEWINKHDIGKYRITGSQVETGCPFNDCPNSGQPQFYINLKTGSYYCHRCNKKGANLKRLEMALGLVELKEPVKASNVFIPVKEIDAWHKELLKNEDALSYLQNQRGFETWVISQFRLGFKHYEDQPVIVIPYFDANGACVGAKYDFYRRPAGGNQKYIKEKGTKTQLFNLNNIDPEQKLVITEGEYDAISAFQYGLDNVGSIPNGANGINGWTEDLASVNRFVLCFDNDAAGNEGAEKFAEHVGKSRCSRVYPRVKDLSDALQMGIEKEEVHNWFAAAEPMFTAGKTSLDEYVSDLEEMLDDPVKYRGESMGYKGFDDTIGGWRNGEITAVLAESNHGKTTYSLDCVGNRFRANKKSLIISGEMTGPEVLEKLANNHLRKKCDINEVKEFAALAKDNIFCPDIDSWESAKEQLSMDSLFDQIMFHVDQKGVSFVVIDHLELFVNDGKDMIKDIKTFMNTCRRLVKKKNIHILLLVQPTKLPDGQRRPTINNIYGSSYVRKAIWNGIVIWREDSKKIVGFSVEKNRKFGLCGEFFLKFNQKSMCNYYE